MSLPATVTTNLWPDHKNAIVGPFPRMAQDKQDTGATGQGIGISSIQERLIQSFKPSVSGTLTNVSLYLQKISSPTDDVLIEIWLGDEITEAPQILIAHGRTIEATTVSTTAGYVSVPLINPVSVTSGTKYWIVAQRTGALDAVNVIQWHSSVLNPYSDGKMRRLDNGVYADITNADARFKVDIALGARYQMAVDKTNNKIRSFKSTDSLTWTEQDSANAPAVSSTSNLKSIFAAHVEGVTISVFVITSSTRLDIFNYNTSSDTWGSSAFNTTAPTFNTNVSGVAPVVGGYRGHIGSALSDYVFCNNGATESIMGNARRRIKLSRRLIADGTWNTPYDVVGSNGASGTPNATLPGTAVDYDVRTAGMDGNGVFHVFYTQSDASDIIHRSFKADNTFDVNTNGVGSPGATSSNSSAYPFGPLCSFLKDGEWWIAFPFDSSGTLKVARCKASLASTGSSWTVTSVATVTLQMTSSNPAVLVPDNRAGEKLFLFYTKSDGKIYYCHDSGTDTWTAEQEFRPGTKTVAGLSAFILDGAVGLSYLDTAPASDAVTYDEILILLWRTYQPVGSHQIDKDFTVAGQENIQYRAEVDELSGTTYAANFYTRETDSDPLGHLGGVGAEGVDTTAIFSTFRFRYAQAVVIITGDTFPSSLTAISGLE